MSQNSSHTEMIVLSGLSPRSSLVLGMTGRDLNIGKEVTSGDPALEILDLLAPNYSEVDDAETD